VYAARGS